MDDNKVTQVPAINQKGFRLGPKITGDTYDTQCVNASAKTLPLHNSIGLPREDINSSKELNKISSKVGRVARAKAEWDKRNIETSFSSNKYQSTTGKGAALNQAQGFGDSTLTRSKRVRASAIGVPSFPHQQLRTEEIKNNAKLAPKSASTGNLTTAGALSPASSPVFQRKAVGIPEQSPLINNTNTSGADSPKYMRKFNGQLVLSTKDQRTKGSEVKRPVKPLKPIKPIKPLILSNNKINSHLEQQTSRNGTLTTTAKTNPKGYLCSNGMKLGPGISLRLTRQRVPSPGSPKPSDSPRSPRSPILRCSSPKPLDSPKSPRSPTTRGKASFALPTSSSLAKSSGKLKDKYPGTTHSRELVKSPVKRHSKPGNKETNNNHLPSAINKLGADFSRTNGNKLIGKNTYIMHGEESCSKEGRTYGYSKTIAQDKKDQVHLDKTEIHPFNDAINDNTELSISPESTITEDMIAHSHVPQENKSSYSEVLKAERETRTPSQIIMHNETPCGGNCLHQHDNKNISSVIQAFDDIQLQDNAIQLNAKLDEENAKMRDIYFKQNDPIKDHNYALLPPDDRETVDVVKDGDDDNVAQVDNTNDCDIVIQQSSHGEKMPLDQTTLQVTLGKETDLLCPYNSADTTIAIGIPEETRSHKPEYSSPVSGIKAADLTSNQLSTTSISMSGNKGDTCGFTTMEQISTTSACTTSDLDGHEELELRLHVSDSDTQKANEGCFMVNSVRESHVLPLHYDKEQEVDTRPAKCLDTSTVTIQVPGQDTENNVYNTESYHQCDSKFENNNPLMDSSSYTTDNDSLNNNKVKVIITNLGNDDDNEEVANSEYDNNNATDDNVLWTDDNNDTHELQPTEEEWEADVDIEEDDGPKGLASSISLFFEAYEAQLKKQASEVEGAFKLSTNQSPPYIAGLSPISNSSHYLRIPGGNNVERPLLGGYRSRSNSICNETIPEEKEPPSSGEEEPQKALEDNLGILKNTPGRINSFQSDRNSSYTDSSLFQSEGSEEDGRTSINLDDWWQTWTMGRQRKTDCHNSDDDEESDLEKVKGMTSRMNLSARRPSTLEWKAKYLDKPPFLWNYVAGKPPVLSPPGSEKEISPKNYSDEDSSKWNEQRVEKINEAISWIRTELMAMKLEDEALARRLISLKTDIRDLRLQKSSTAHKELIEDAIAAGNDVIHDAVDPPIDPQIDPALRHYGVTRMNISTRRFSVF